MRLQRAFIHIDGAIDLNLQGLDSRRRPAIGLDNIPAGEGFVQADPQSGPFQHTAHPPDQRLRTGFAMTIAQHDVRLLFATAKMIERGAGHGMPVDQYSRPPFFSNSLALGLREQSPQCIMIGSMDEVKPAIDFFHIERLTIDVFLGAQTAGDHAKTGLDARAQRKRRLGQFAPDQPGIEFQRVTVDITKSTGIAAGQAIDAEIGRNTDQFIDKGILTDPQPLRRLASLGDKTFGVVAPAVRQAVNQPAGLMWPHHDGRVVCGMDKMPGPGAFNGEVAHISTLVGHSCHVFTPNLHSPCKDSDIYAKADMMCRRLETYMTDPMKKILLAEDEDSVRSFLSRALQRAGYDVVSCPDGDTAILALDQGPYDLLLTDIVMPGADGIEVAKRAAQLQPDLKIMFITGFAAVALNAQKASPNAKVLEKPVHLREIVTEVERLIAA